MFCLCVVPLLVFVLLSRRSKTYTHAHLARSNYPTWSPSVLKLTSLFLCRNVRQTAGTLENDKVKQRIEIIEVELTKVYHTRTSHWLHSSTMIHKVVLSLITAPCLQARYSRILLCLKKIISIS